MAPFLVALVNVGGSPYSYKNGECCSEEEMYIFGIEEAAEKLDWLIDLAKQGEEVHIYRNGKPCVRVIAVSA